jgi:hypothetical protein
MLLEIDVHVGPPVITWRIDGYFCLMLSLGILIERPSGMRAMIDV